MAKAHPIRPFLPADARPLRELFAQSIDVLTADDYSEDQRVAWAATSEDLAGFAQRLAGSTTLVVMANGQHAGFASLRGNTELDMLYVHPHFANQGIGSTLCDALERGDSIILFPEGTRSPDGLLHKAKPGVGLMACKTGVPVVPCRIFGSFEAFGKGAKVRQALEAALAEHRKDPNAKPSQPPLPPLIIEKVPSAKGYRGCIHCHQVKEILRAEEIKAGTWHRDKIYTFPLPENIGITLDHNKGNLVNVIKPDSPAAKAGLKPGDLIDKLNGYSVRSFWGMPGIGKGLAEGEPGFENEKNLKLTPSELAYKDAMNVLEMARKEFNIDENRIFLTGHSMGGMGSYYMAARNPEIWAGVAPIAGGGINDRYAPGEKIKNLPFLVMHGEKDKIVSVDQSRNSTAKMKELGMKYKYLEIPGADHEIWIRHNARSWVPVFEFFNSLTKGKEVQK